MPASHHSVFKGQMPFLLPNQERQSSEEKCSLFYAKITKPPGIQASIFDACPKPG